MDDADLASEHQPSQRQCVYRRRLVDRQPLAGSSRHYARPERIKFSTGEPIKEKPKIKLIKPEKKPQIRIK
jgi:hypothetical protein